MPFLPVPPVVEAADELLASARTLVDAASAAFIADPDVGVSCTAGCSACCSQAVPVSPAELRSIVAAIDRLPEARRTEITGRIAHVEAALAAACVSPATFVDAGDDPDARQSAAMRYFALDLACPLLHEGVCSVRDDRPLACREYLVTSDPVHCAAPGATAEQVVRIRSRVDVRRGFAEVSAVFGEPGHRILTFALADALRDGPPPAPPAEPRSGPRTAALLTPPLA